MAFELFCATLIALLFGAFVCFAGYRFFIILLPIWGFFFGFGLGAQAVQALLGDAFFGTVTSWAVGFIVALIFAVFSYLFYFFGVAILAGSLGYGLGVALMGAIGLQFGLITLARRHRTGCGIRCRDDHVQHSEVRDHHRHRTRWRCACRRYASARC